MNLGRGFGGSGHADNELVVDPRMLTRLIIHPQHLRVL